MVATIIGVMGPDHLEEKDAELAFQVGRMVAEHGWMLLTGGRDRGVMDAASRGAKSAGGTTIGILPTADGAEASDAVDIKIVTGMGSARDNINALSSNILIAIGMGPGTAAEVALALKAGKHVVLMGDRNEAHAFFSSLKASHVHKAADAATAIALVQGLRGQA